MTNNIKLAPSILSADFANLERDIRRVREAGADYLHVDVMDGRFVPNITIGVPVVKSIRAVTDMVLDVHLMIENAEKYVEPFFKAGADIINVHAETFGSSDDLARVISLIRSFRVKAGVTVKPATDVSAVLPVLSSVDLVLVMSVEPGFGGQKFIPESLGKIKQLRDIVTRDNLKAEIEVDGGVTLENVHRVIEAGANVIVAGSAVFEGDAAGNVRKFIDVFGMPFRELHSMSFCTP